MGKPFKVSQSKIKTYRRCREAYHLKYVEKLKKRRIRRPFRFGNIIHDMLEADANGDDPFEKLDEIAEKDVKMFTAEREAYGDIVEDSRVIMQHYFEYWGDNSLMYLRRGMQCAEHEFNVEIAPGIIATGKIDGAVRTPNKLNWLMEHKSFSKVPSEDHRWRNIQSATYLRIVEMQGWWKNLSGMCWDYVKSKPPSQPKLLKSGKLSTAFVNSLPGVVIDTIEKHGLKKKDYADLIASAEANQKNYFFRHFTPIQKTVVDEVFKGFVDTAKRMSQYHGTEREMNVDLHCDYCDYEPICRARLTGSDVDFVKEREYYHDDKGKEVEPDIDEEERSE